MRAKRGMAIRTYMISHGSRISNSYSSGAGSAVFGLDAHYGTGRSVKIKKRHNEHIPFYFAEQKVLNFRELIVIMQKTMN